MVSHRYGLRWPDNNTEMLFQTYQHYFFEYHCGLMSMKTMYMCKKDLHRLDWYQQLRISQNKPDLSFPPQSTLFCILVFLYFCIFKCLIFNVNLIFFNFQCLCFVFLYFFLRLTINTTWTYLLLISLFFTFAVSNSDNLLVFPCNATRLNANSPDSLLAQWQSVSWDEKPAKWRYSIYKQRRCFFIFFIFL